MPRHPHPPAGFVVGSPPAMPGGFLASPDPRQRPHSAAGAVSPMLMQGGPSPPQARPPPTKHLSHLPRPAAHGPLQSLTASVDELSLASARRASSESHGYHAGGWSDNTSSTSGGPPSLNVPVPDLAQLGVMREKAMASGDDRRKLRWAKQVIKFVERKHDGNKISDASLVRHIDEAISHINRMAEAARPDAEALFLRGDLLASGSFPSYHRKDLRSAFNDFELSARMGHAPSWFRIGRDYEVLGDATRAKDAYERGCSVQDVGCVYRMGMANLLGQLEIAQDKPKAIALLREAADGADEDTPQPAYIYGMLLAGEFSHVEVPAQVVQSLLHSAGGRPVANLEAEARRRIERAAYLNFAPAQYKCGWCYEYAQLECSFDPLLSVQYYSLASQGGEIEADMALSKWFLCGAEGCFDKNEALAFTFAEKAARKQLPSAEFALAYYFEVGVGCTKDLELAKKWYRKAMGHGNDDAKERLDALAAPTPQTLSRKEHEGYVDVKLQRKRTEAKMLSDKRNTIINKRNQRQGVSEVNNNNGSNAANEEAKVRNMSRRKTMKMVEETAGGRRGRLQDPAPPPPPPLPTNQPDKNAASRADKLLPAPSEVMMPDPAALQQQQHQQQPPRQPLPDSGRRPSGFNNSGQQQSPARLGVAGPPPRASSPRPMPHRQPQPSSSGGGSGGGGNDIPLASKTPAKVYESFSEMGFAAKPVKDDKDCTIM